MGYYMAGDYYRRGDLWSKAAGVAKKVWANPYVQTAAMMIPGGAVVKAGMAVRAGIRGATAVAKPIAVGAATGLAVNALSNTGGWFGGDRKRGKRIDIGNIKALRRAMRRVNGFAHLAKSTIQFTKTTRMKQRGKR